MDVYDRLACLFKALANPTRLRILYALQNGDQYVDHLCVALDRRQPNISQHLTVLKQAGLVQCYQVGNRIRYCLPRQEVIRLLELASATIQKRVTPLAQTVWIRCHCPRCQQIREQAMSISVWLTANDCGHRVRIAVARVDEGGISLSIAGTCASALSLGEALPPLDLADELSKPLNETQVYTLAMDYLCRSSCLVPGALLETLQVIAGLATPSTSRIVFASQAANPIITRG
ncbi:MAG: metalloregulator ArsR/SmtB family transcription factor [Anaerolineae bacterium]|nr:metalloregulator ArsR/SmtB family transcription factor [Anaerolineae bacterium]MDH7475224.1 metalloregulator ArsR/SmtB family transcription factor [Anaerolineae bacterium]